MWEYFETEQLSKQGLCLDEVTGVTVGRLHLPPTPITQTLKKTRIRSCRKGSGRTSHIKRNKRDQRNGRTKTISSKRVIQNQINSVLGILLLQ